MESSLSVLPKAGPGLGFVHLAADQQQGWLPSFFLLNPEL